MIDWDRVAELRDEIGPEDFGEVVELFLHEVGNAIALLQSAEGNPVVMMDQMHFLKGAALNLGFEAMARLCQSGESAARLGDTTTVTPAEVAECFACSRAAFETDLPRRFAA